MQGKQITLVIWLILKACQLVWGYFVRMLIVVIGYQVLLFNANNLQTDLFDPMMGP